MISIEKGQVTIVGGGFTGLSAAYELAKSGIRVTVLEAENEIGGLAAAFDVAGVKLDRFYHHWFTNDLSVMELISELGLDDKVVINTTNTGVYYANNFFKLSTPCSAECWVNDLSQRLARPALLLGRPDKQIDRVAWCSGGAQGMFADAIALGVDAFVTGEVSEQNQHMAMESDCVFVAAGHHVLQAVQLRRYACFKE